MPIHNQIGYPQALQIRGRVGYAYTFRWRNNQQEIYKYHYPYNPKTVGQQANRAKFAQAVSNWQGFSDSVKQFYNSKKYPYSMSGYNRYIRYYMNN